MAPFTDRRPALTRWTRARGNHRALLDHCAFVDSSAPTSTSSTITGMAPTGRARRRLAAVDVDVRADLRARATSVRIDHRASPTTNADHRRHADRRAPRTRRRGSPAAGRANDALDARASAPPACPCRRTAAPPTGRPGRRAKPEEDARKPGVHAPSGRRTRRALRTLLLRGRRRSSKAARAAPLAAAPAYQPFDGEPKLHVNVGPRSFKADDLPATRRARHHRQAIHRLAEAHRRHGEFDRARIRLDEVAQHERHELVVQLAGRLVVAALCRLHQL